MSPSPPAGSVKLASERAVWAPGPREPQLVRAEVHVWRVDLMVLADDVACCLSADETARAARIVGERERALWARSRGVLRALLGRYLDEDPTATELVVGPHGKPQLADGGGRPRGPFFNLSHSQHIALYAFTATGAIGVDVQLARDANAGAASDHVALARRMFGEAEAQRLNELAPAMREREFLRLWTRHEAELKRRGTGIGAVESEADGSTAAEEARTAGPRIVELDVGVRAAAAVAFAYEASELRLWEWR
jgi:4'-phosphopantetheinyl transferase